MIRLSLPLLLAAACAVEPAPPTVPDTLPTEGRTLVIDSIDVPSSAEESNLFALDLDGDGFGDNLFGQTLAIANNNLDVDLDGAVAAALDRGELLHLLVFAEDATGEFLDTGRLFLGADTDGDPANNFTGDAELAVRDGVSITDAAFGAVDFDGVELADGVLTVENVLFAPIRLPLRAGRIVGRFDNLGRFEGLIAGAVNAADMRRLRDSVAGAVANEANEMCDSQQIPCCPADSRGEIYMSLFDVDQDCHLAVSEVASSEIFAILIGTDLDLDHDGVDDAMSVSFRITAVPARFEVPAAEPEI